MTAQRWAYYNEHDTFAAAWLRELIKENLIAPGEVDERSIEDVTPYDLRSFRQCHFFAGIGIWSLAARRAGWRDDETLWSGSCPCQPFSAAGKGEGFDDERHLWPAFFHLIEQCRPPLIVGEQVAGADGDAWLDLVSSDLDAAAYAFGAAETCAAGFGAPHIRSRNYWVAVANLEGSQGLAPAWSARQGGEGRAAERNGAPDRLADGDLPGAARHGRDGDEVAAAGRLRDGYRDRGGADGVADALGDGHRQHRHSLGGEAGAGEGELSGGAQRFRPDLADGGTAYRLGHAPDESRGPVDGIRGRTGTEPSGGRGAIGLAVPGSVGRERGQGPAQGGVAYGPDARRVEGDDGSVRGDEAGAERLADDAEQGRRGIPARDGREDRGTSSEPRRLRAAFGHNRGPGPVNGLWGDADWLRCRDEKWRAVEPGTFPLVDAGSFRNRVGLLRGAGNAITLGQAEGFLTAVRGILR